MGQTGHEIYPRISRRRSNFKCCFGRNCLGRYQDQKQDIGFFWFHQHWTGSPLDSGSSVVSTHLWQQTWRDTPCRLALQKVTHKLPSEQSQGYISWPNPSSLRLESLGCFNMFSVGLSVALWGLPGEKSSCTPLRPAGFPCLLDEWLNVIGLAELRPSRWSDGMHLWHPWLLTNAWILKKATLALQEACTPGF